MEEPMKKKIAIAVVALAVFTALVAGAASSATAFPTKTKACSSCHATAAAVKITLTRSSSTTTTVTYKIKVTGGSGVAGWALLKGSTNVKHKTASTGSFTVKKGVAYKVWAVKKGSGAKSKALTVAK
jgi:hypothetical protein